MPGAGVAEPRRLFRPAGEAWLGGVCAGFAQQFGVSVLLVRTLFVLLAAWRLIGVAGYLSLWLLMPPERSMTATPGAAAATRTGMRTEAELQPVPGTDLGQAIPLALLGAGLTWIIQSQGWGLSMVWLAAGGSTAAGLGLVWYIADQSSTTRGDGRSGWRRLLAPLLNRWTTVLGLVLGLLLVALGVVLALTALPPVGPVGSVALAVALSLAAVALIIAPWFLRIRRALSVAREEKLLSDARADMAAHLHDSVLQTLALIQRQAGDPQEVVRLARRQERQLRTWLYGDEPTAETLRDALQQAAQAVEDDFPVRVECVTVSDTPLTPELTELVKAAREAMVNAAKHSGADLVDVYAEVGEDGVEVFVRDRGSGFDPEVIAEDRMGVRGSILDRMSRHHGVARIRSGDGRGTEVSLEMKR